MPNLLSRRALWLALALVVSMLSLGVAAALAARSQPETYQALLGQIARGEVRSATLTPKKMSVKIRTATRQRFVATYPPNAEAQLVSMLRSHGARVRVRRGVARSSSGHLRYRYIALGILVLGGLAALAYYLLRARPAAAGNAAGPTGSEPGPSTEPGGSAPAETPPGAPGERAPPPSGSQERP